MFAMEAIPSNTDIASSNCVMVTLRDDFSFKRKQKMEIKPVISMPYQEKLRLILAALQGLKTYIEIADSDDVAKWDYDKRNKILHGGLLLDCLCVPSSADKDASTKYKAEVERVTKFKKTVGEAVKKRSYCEDVKNISVTVLEI